MAFLPRNRLSLAKWHFWTVVVVYFLTPGIVLAHSYESMTAILARVNVSYEEPVTGLIRSVTAEIGRFADNKVGNAEGILFTGVSERTSVPKATRAGCSLDLEKPPPKDPWIALFIKGSCSDEKKVRNAKMLNASAVLLFGNDQETYLQREKKFKDGPIVIYLLYRKGELFWHLVQSGTRVHIAISRGQEVKFRITSINRTSVLFVSVSFIVLMVVSLAWLVFYYIQRFRYINAKDRLARHLNNAARKALAKIPDRHLRKDDNEIKEKDSCAVCIEPYQQGDSVRILPCKHKFHKACVDPWLLDHRTCPMCKMDILKHYGYTPNSSEESRAEATAEEGRAPQTRRTGAGNPPPVVTHITAQVSIISERPVVACDVNPVERSSSNPVGDILPPMVGPVSGIGTTTSAVIRSMIQSAKTRVSPARPLAPVHSAVSAESILPCEEEATADEVRSCVELEADSNPEEESILELTNGGIIVPIIETESLHSPDATQSHDIEFLVREILDLEAGTESSMSPRLSSQSCCSEPRDALPADDVTDRPETPPPSAAAAPPPLDVFGPPSNKLPAVDCQATTGTPSVQSLVPPDSRRVSLSRFGSTPPTDFEDDEESPPSRRPSSHVVSISHS